MHNSAGSRLLLVFWIWSPAASRTTPGCPLQPLKRNSQGNLSRLSSRAPTTCAEYAPGCPYSVPFPNFPCLVSCVASESDCVHMNRRTPSVTPYSPWSCTSCSISGCEACVYDHQGQVHCAKCFDGFRGAGGEHGKWQHCELANVRLIVTVSEALAAVLVLLLVGALFTTCFGAWHWDLHQLLHPGESSNASLTSNLIRGGTLKNKDAIGQGLLLSMMSSIKYSSMRLYSEVVPSSAPILRQLTTSSLDKQLVDIGLGLQLFFNTQRFLICMAFVTWMVASALSWAAPEVESALVKGGGCSFALDASLQLAEGQLYRARVQGKGCLILWIVLLVMTWIFHLYQLYFVDSYDKCTHTAEDYTVRLEGLPPSATSEQKVKEVLEEELRMQGLIHGVCICYNVLDVPEPERLEEMIDRLIEIDDLSLGLYEPELSTPLHLLEEESEKDKERLKSWLVEGKLHGSGTAYVVFRKQRDVARVIAERRGVARKIFEPTNNPNDVQDDENDSFELETVEIVKDNSEPAGVRFEAFKQPLRQLRMNEFVWMPLRMITYIALYGIAAHLYFVYMIKPWEDNFIVGAESNIGVKLGGKLVLLFNFGIQTLVMMDVERGGFLRHAHVDSNTLVWNTILLLVTNFYVVMQEVYRDGYRWILVPPTGCLHSSSPPERCWDWLRLLFQSVATEKEVGGNLVSVLTEQIMMLYVLGEVANVLMPVIFNWVALRLIFVINVGGSSKSWFSRTLRAMLPSSSSATSITAREAEKAQILMPLLLWMEYTYIVIFPAMALVTFYLVTDKTSTVCMWLTLFAVLHFFWQRYVMLWLYGKATYDSTESYEAFIQMWGLVLSMLPPASIWWAFRQGEIKEGMFAMLSMFLVFMLVLLLYRYSLFIITWFAGRQSDGIDDMEGGGDPGYKSIVDNLYISWWNRNPVYVLKHRLCPDLPGHEVHGSDCPCFPKGCMRESYFELGKEFRHLPHQKLKQAIKRARSQSDMIVKQCERTTTVEDGLSDTAVHKVDQPANGVAYEPPNSSPTSPPLDSFSPTPASQAVLPESRSVHEEVLSAAEATPAIVVDNTPLEAVTQPAYEEAKPESSPPGSAQLLLGGGLLTQDKEAESLSAPLESVESAQLLLGGGLLIQDDEAQEPSLENPDFPSLDLPLLDISAGSTEAVTAPGSTLTERPDFDFTAAQLSSREATQQPPSPQTTTQTVAPTPVQVLHRAQRSGPAPVTRVPLPAVVPSPVATVVNAEPVAVGLSRPSHVPQPLPSGIATPASGSGLVPSYDIRVVAGSTTSQPPSYMSVPGPHSSLRLPQRQPQTHRAVQAPRLQQAPVYYTPQSVRLRPAGSPSPGPVQGSRR